MFSGTIESNIRLGSPISRERVMTAAEDVNLAPFLNTLPSGLDHPVNERGTTLSVGQRQLLAFARALGEYGSVVFISGNMPMKTEIVPLLIITKLEQYDYSGATAIAVVMLVSSFILLLLINLLQKWSRRYHAV